jgi:malate synthase
MPAPTCKLLNTPKTEEEKLVLATNALDFVANLHAKFNRRRLQLLDARNVRHKELRDGKAFDFLQETKSIRDGIWEVAKTPKDLLDRRVEITGPAEAKMMINALNSGAKAFMCDFEDALAPTWKNLIHGQHCLIQAYQKTLKYTAPETGKSYQLAPHTATLLVRPRGWHLHEKHLLINNEPTSASLMDFGFAFFHNAKTAIKNQTGPYFYLPKMESHLEAALWNEVFLYAQDFLGTPKGTIKCTVLIETLPAAFEMDEILYELRDHIVGLNAGRWDYIFSAIKKLAHLPDAVLPDRSQVTMAVPFMQSYCNLLVQTCHRRNAHAMGGMAAFIPSRKDAEVNQLATAKVREDKDREVRLGFDGTWVAHPDLVPLATEVFSSGLGSKPNQKDVKREDVKVKSRDLVDLKIAGGKITPAGVAANIAVAIQYIHHWLQGSGAVALYNLMEDAATAEISRSQLWQWLHQKVTLSDGRSFTEAVYQQIKADELLKLEGGAKAYQKATQLLDRLVMNQECADFLTLIAYQELAG